VVFIVFLFFWYWVILVLGPFLPFYLLGFSIRIDDSLAGKIYIGWAWVGSGGFSLG